MSVKSPAKRKTVAVIGAGPGGLTAAMLLAARDGGNARRRSRELILTRRISMERAKPWMVGLVSGTLAMLALPAAAENQAPPAASQGKPHSTITVHVETLRNDYGITVAGRIPHVLPPNEHNRFYLETKAKRSGHMINFCAEACLPEQSDTGIPPESAG